jgi:hypothetical protein
MAKAVMNKKETKKPARRAAEKNQTTKVAFDKAANNTRRATGSGAKPFWYLNHVGDLAAVTKEASNLNLGISRIDIFEPTEKQEAIGILCKVKVHTLAATIDNISIFESEFSAGDIYMQMGGGRNIGGEGEEAKWVRDCKLTAQGKAQVLSYVSTLLVPNK